MTTSTHAQRNDHSDSRFIANLEIMLITSDVNTVAASVRCTINSHEYTENEPEGGYLDVCCWLRHSAENRVLRGRSQTGIGVGNK